MQDLVRKANTLPDQVSTLTPHATKEEDKVIDMTGSPPPEDEVTVEDYPSSPGKTQQGNKAPSTDPFRTIKVEAVEIKPPPTYTQSNFPQYPKQPTTTTEAGSRAEAKVERIIDLDAYEPKQVESPNRTLNTYTQQQLERLADQQPRDLTAAFNTQAQQEQAQDAGPATGNTQQHAYENKVKQQTYLNDAWKPDAGAVTAINKAMSILHRHQGLSNMTKSKVTRQAVGEAYLALEAIKNFTLPRAALAPLNLGALMLVGLTLYGLDPTTTDEDLAGLFERATKTLRPVPHDFKRYLMHRNATDA